MGTRKRSVLAGALVIGVVATVVTVGVGGAGAESAELVVETRGGGNPLGFLDIGHDGRIDIGDRLSGRVPIVDPATGADAGSSLLDCVAQTRTVDAAVGHGAWLCTVVFVLPDGNLHLQGKDPAGAGPYTFAVMGGTGAYRDARGEADALDTFTGTTFTVHLET